MNTTIKQVVSLLLVLQVVFASVGLAVYSHTCNMLGLTETSLLEEKSCCPKDKEPVTEEKDSCCHSSVDHVDADLDAIYQDLVQFSFTLFSFFANFSLPDWPALPILESLFLHLSDSSPPTLYGRQLLHFIHILRI